jgi:hypothetical protein
MAETSEVWDQARIEHYISEGTEEYQLLEYKAADALAKADGKKSEISKDVSAMANAAGGVIVYGVAEFQDEKRKHLPEKIDPVDRTQFSKEWLEQVINSNIQPRIDGIIIHPVPIDTAPTHVVYVVEIPQGHTAHQAKDCRYHRRYNFEVLAMLDHEIRDVMGRRQFPRIELEFEIEITRKELRDRSGLSGVLGMGMGGRSYDPPRFVDRFELTLRVHNAGAVYAQYVNAFIEVPDVLLRIKTPDEEMYFGGRETFEKIGILYHRHYEDNTVRDIIGHQGGGFVSIPNYGPARYVPILPGRSQGWEEIELNENFGNLSLGDLFIEWEIFADNAPPLPGRIAVQDIKITDKRNKAE